MMIQPRGYKQNIAPKDEELLRMQSGARVKGVLPEIEDTIAHAKDRLVTQAEMAVAKGELTPERALSLWQEHYAYSTVLKSMQTKARLGEAAGERIAAIINEGE